MGIISSCHCCRLNTISERHFSTGFPMQPLESLESKLVRLSPDQRKEVEDFVDLLLSRSGPFPLLMFDSLDPSPLPIRNVAPPSLTMIEPVHLVEIPPLPPKGTIGSERHVSTSERDTQISSSGKGGCASDLISRDYMDYGQFEQSSPGTEAVKKIQRKMIAPDGNDKTRQLLDWID